MLRIALAAGFLLGPWAVAYGQTEDAKAGIEFFEQKVRPLLAQRCYECHSRQAKKVQGGLRLDSRAAIYQGGDSGPAVVAGKPNESRLIEAVGYEGDTQMPPSGKLPQAELALLNEWVRRGAPLPDDGPQSSAKTGIDFAAGRRFWSFQPPRRVGPPAVQAQAWPRRAIDAFVLAGLEKQHLAPSAPADRRTLIRRATFDLIGLPPTPDEVARFVDDPAPDAYEKLIERLLDSPHYGERWARYWLDLARYSDKVASWFENAAGSWLYRDWVVRAFNEDVPYNTFVCRQLAADLMPQAAVKDNAALGFLGLSPEYWKEPRLDKEIIKGIVAEEWEERIDTVGRTFLGLTVACARCHDHKFDPISTEDYYALAGVLASTRRIERPIVSEPQATMVRTARRRVTSMREEVKKLEPNERRSAEVKFEIETLNRIADEIERTTPRYRTAMAEGLDDAALYVLADGPDATKLDYRPGEARDLHVQIRGNPSRPGPLVPRRFLTVLSPDGPQPFTHGSGRLDLAQAIVGQGAPLSARVIVNRVWRYHFGRGIVETPSDFGAQGGRPSHPELLDDLTARFIEHGWSIKWLHREIMLSAAYRQSSAQDAAKFAVDPDNRWLWRMTRRRLDIESWRDAMLSVSGILDLQIGGPPEKLSDALNLRRTIYGSIDREEPDDMLRLYDFPDASAHSPTREPTTTGLQQLFVLNSPFIEREAAALGGRILREQPTDADAQVRRAYQLLFARPASDAEVRLGVEYVSGGKPGQAPTVELWRQYAHVLLGTNEFLFVD